MSCTSCKEREHSFRVHVTCSFTKLINDVATRLSCQNAYRNFRSCVWKVLCLLQTGLSMRLRNLHAAAQLMPRLAPRVHLHANARDDELLPIERWWNDASALAPDGSATRDGDSSLLVAFQLILPIVAAILLSRLLFPIVHTSRPFFAIPLPPLFVLAPVVVLLAALGDHRFDDE